ncbi:DUF6531 domain-containing protein [Streptomyces aidingensis]|uniref:RHS repeat-associated core domain-containing protein n=1 Tax=Streptomyces aidingensis TaxID=910347 RepID=A0A1I1SC64_9ACTN|nr:DUF6531 domain-containing protein [Streptomyces aidingensis]SFD44075.1 RHS repeat-associated core domain-containing protein [Streptomyces aidingensis]
MGRASDWSPLDMDGDPTPGDPPRIEQLGNKFTTFADDVFDALQKVRALGEDGTLASFVGESADAYQDKFDKVPPNLEKLHTSYDLAGQALLTYAPKLEDAQRDADQALTDAEDARAELATARSWLERATSTLEDAEEEAEPPDEGEVSAEVRRALSDAQLDAGNAQTAVDDAREKLNAAIALAQQAKEAREEAAERCKRDLEEASDAGIQNKKWWQKAVDWVVDNWDTIVNVCKVIVAVVGIVAMIIGGPLALLVLAAALIVLADTLIKYANGEASLWDVAFAALDCIPGMKGLTTAAGLLKGIKSGMKGLAAGAKGMGRTIRQQAKQMAKRNGCGDPVDVATGELFMSAIDVELPGALPLIIERHHISGYRDGRYFGSSWSSTLDLRLVLADDGVRFFAADGMTLLYPVPLPDPEHPVLPVEGPRWGLAWDGRPGTPLTIHRPDTGHTLHFAHVAGRPGNELPLAAVTDRNNNRIDVHYDDNGDPREVSHSGGYRIGVAVYDRRITSLRLLSAPDEPVLRAYDYDGAGNLAKVFNSSGLPHDFTYDDHARLIRWEDRNGLWYAYEYDDAGRCVFSTGTDRALEYRYAYDEHNHRTTATDSLGHATVYQFNDSYQLVAETDPLGNTTRREWDRYDRLLSLTDPLGHTTRYEYDEQGSPTAVVRPDGHRTTAENGEFGLPVAVTQPDGGVWRLEYDSRGNLTAETDPAGARIAYRYNSTGSVTAITDAAGRTVRMETDAAGMPVSATDAEGATTLTGRDAFGRLVLLTDPSGGRTHFSYTPEGLLSRRTLPDGTTEQREYDPEGNLVVHTGPAGDVTRFEYTVFDLPSARTDPDGTRLEFAYDTELRLASVTNQLGQTWRYHYDAAGRLSQEQDFHGRTRAYRHDAAGRLTGMTNAAGETTSYVRNLLGKIAEQYTPEGVTTFTYDPMGNLLHAHSPDAELRYERDPMGRILAETCNGATLRNVYDILGRRIRRTTPSNAESVWEYDGRDKPVSLRTAGRTVTFGYDAAGRETERRTGAAVLAQTWDAAGRLSTQTLTAHGLPDTPGPRPVQHRSYRYRADGTVSAITDLLRGYRTIDVNSTGRVTAVQAATWTERYAYDDAGNLAQGEWHQANPPRPDASRSSRDITYEYDAQGRVVVRRRKRLSRKPDVWRYSWDSQDRLTGVITPDGTRWAYRYDPFGRRIAKQRLGADGSTVAEQVVFTWDGFVPAEQTVLSEDGTAECTVWDWERDRFSPVAQTHRVPASEQPQEWIDERFYAIVTDLVGTPTELVDDHGRIAWHSRTTLWGAQLPDARSGEAACPLRFPGQYHDPETAFHYNYQRHYDPETGQYMSLDPLGLAPGPNPRAYVANPHTQTDSLGLAPDCETAARAAARARADLEQARPGANKHTRPTSAAGLSVPGHPQTFSGASIKGGGNHNLHPDVQAAYDRVPTDIKQRMGGQHGRCGEAEALSDALHAGVDPRGGTMAAVNVRASGNDAHGTPKPPCPSCKDVLEQFGITAVV